MLFTREYIELLFFGIDQEFFFFSFWKAAGRSERCSLRIGNYVLNKAAIPPSACEERLTYRVGAVTSTYT